MDQSKFIAIEAQLSATFAQGGDSDRTEPKPALQEGFAIAVTQG